MYTSAMHFWYCIHLLNTPLYSNVFVPCHSNLSAVLFMFLLLLREKPDGDCQRVCHAIWPFSICVSCLHMCVRVCVFVSNRNYKNNDMNRNLRDCTNRLLTAEADTLVQGISETVSVLAWVVTRWLRRTGRQKIFKKEQGDYRDVVPNSVRGFTSFPCVEWWSQGGGGGINGCVCVCVCAGQCNRLVVSFLPDWSPAVGGYW